MISEIYTPKIPFDFFYGRFLEIENLLRNEVLLDKIKAIYFYRDFLPTALSHPLIVTNGILRLTEVFQTSSSNCVKKEIYDALSGIVPKVLHVLYSVDELVERVFSVLCTSEDSSAKLLSVLTLQLFASKLGKNLFLFSKVIDFILGCQYFDAQEFLDVNLACASFSEHNREFGDLFIRRILDGTNTKPSSAFQRWAPEAQFSLLCSLRAGVDSSVLVYRHCVQNLSKFSSSYGDIRCRMLAINCACRHSFQISRLREELLQLVAKEMQFILQMLADDSLKDPKICDNEFCSDKIESLVHYSKALIKAVSLFRKFYSNVLLQRIFGASILSLLKSKIGPHLLCVLIWIGWQIESHFLVEIEMFLLVEKSIQLSYDVLICFIKASSKLEHISALEKSLLFFCKENFKMLSFRHQKLLLKTTFDNTKFFGREFCVLFAFYALEFMSFSKKTLKNMNFLEMLQLEAFIVHFVKKFDAIQRHSLSDLIKQSSLEVEHLMYVSICLNQNASINLRKKLKDMSPFELYCRAITLLELGYWTEFDKFLHEHLVSKHREHFLCNHFLFLSDCVVGIQNKSVNCLFQGIKKLLFLVEVKKVGYFVSFYTAIADLFKTYSAYLSSVEQSKYLTVLAFEEGEASFDDWEVFALKFTQLVVSFNAFL